MGRRADVTNAQRQTIINMRQAGVTVTRIALQLNFSRWTVSRICRRFNQTGSAAKKLKTGRTPKTTPRDDRILRRMAMANQFQSLGRLNATWSQQIQIQTSMKTARRRLSHFGLHSRIARRKPLISLVNRQRRLRWCTRVRGWTTEENWSKLVFSDESKFNLDFDDGRTRVWRSNGDAMLPRNLSMLRRRSNVSVMVWGCITIHGVGELVVVDGNVNQQVYINILAENLKQSIANTFGDENMPFFFQHDNAPAHKARSVERWLDDNGIQTIQWPAQSPDINIIENLWDDIGKAVQRDRPSSRQELIASIFRAWENITPLTIERLYQSLPRRIRAVIRAHGYPTKY